MSRLRGAAPAGPFGFLVPHVSGSSSANTIQLSKADAIRWRYLVENWAVSIRASGTLPYVSYTTDAQGVASPANYEFSLGQLTATTTAGTQEAGSFATYNPQENQLLASYVISPQMYVSGTGTLVQPILCTGDVTSTDPQAQDKYGTLFGVGSITPFAIFGGAPMTYDPVTQLFTPSIAIGAAISICCYQPGSGAGPSSGGGLGPDFQTLASVAMSLPAADIPGYDQYEFAAIPPDASTAVIDGNTMQVQGLASQVMLNNTPQTGPQIGVGSDFSLRFLAGPAVYFPYYGAYDNVQLYNTQTGAPLVPIAQIDAAVFP